MTFYYKLDIIKIENEKPQTWIAELKCLNTSKLAKVLTDVFFIGYFCLLIITANAIIKANVMIVTDTRPANSNFIIICKISISIIRLTSLLEANHICLFSFPIVDTI